MTTTKKQSISFQMPPFEDVQREALMTYALAIDPSRALSQEEQRLVMEASRHLQIIKYEAVKVTAMQEEVGKLHKNASASFETVVKHHFSVQEQAQGKEYQVVLEKFHEYDLNVCAKHQEQIIEVGFYNMMKKLSEPLAVPKEPEVVTVVKERPPRGLLERLFGGQA
jgi:hypothetical protein